MFFGQSSPKYSREKAMTSSTCQTQKAWNQQMSEPINPELSCDLRTLERSETTTGKTEEAEISKTGTREKIKHSLSSH